jgi:hypothetical protein
MKPGQCYEETFNIMLNDDIVAKEGVIVHGKVRDPKTKRWIEHAWIEMGNVVIDPTISDGMIPIKKYYDNLNAKPEKRYTNLEAVRNAFKLKKGFAKW